MKDALTYSTFVRVLCTLMHKQLHIWIHIRAHTDTHTHTHRHMHTDSGCHHPSLSIAGFWKGNLAGHLACISAEVIVSTSSLLNTLLFSKGCPECAQLSVATRVRKNKATNWDIAEKESPRSYWWFNSAVLEIDLILMQMILFNVIFIYFSCTFLTLI